MHYLVSLAPEKSNPEVEKFAGNGEPVVPGFPPTNNMFLSIKSFLQVPYAIVVEENLDMEALAAELHKQFPGLPLVMHQAYVLYTAIACKDLELGTRVRVIQTYNTCDIQVLGTDQLINLWQELPTKGAN